MLQIYRDPHYISKFAIYGERHTGTKFLEETIKKTFEIDITNFYGFKHWMGFANPDQIKYKDRSVLFFGIVRHPYEWLNSFYALPHHVSGDNTISFEKFLLNEWYSIDGCRKEILLDRNYTTQPNTVRYKNVFEMRKQKMIYLSEIMPTIAQNYILLTYEYFVQYHTKVIEIISDRFSLLKRGTPPKALIPSKTTLDQKIKNIIDTNIDWSIESIFGYAPR